MRYFDATLLEVIIYDYYSMGIKDLLPPLPPLSLLNHSPGIFFQSYRHCGLLHQLPLISLGFKDPFPVALFFFFYFYNQKLAHFSCGSDSLLLIRFSDIGMLPTLFDTLTFKDHSFLP